jgi:hypothetical protein
MIKQVDTATSYRKLFYERLDERYPLRGEENYPDPKTVELMYQAYLDGIEAERAIDDRWEDKIREDAVREILDKQTNVVDAVIELLGQLNTRNGRAEPEEMKHVTKASLDV